MILDSRPFTFDRVARIFFTLLIVCAIVFVSIQIKEALLPFLIAWLIAYLINPLVGFFQYKLRIKNRVASILLALLSVAIVIAGIVWAISPSIKDEIDKLNILISYYQAHGGFIRLIPTQWSEYVQKIANPDKIISSMSKEDINQLIQQIVPQFWVFITNSLSIVLGFLASAIILLYIIFILLDFDRITNGFVQLAPQKYRAITEQLLTDVTVSMNRYFRGQALVSMIVGILFAIGFRIIGLPMGIILGLFIGMLNLVPYLHIVGIVPMALMSLLKASETGQNFWAIFGLALGVMCIIQVLLDSIIVPKIMGKVTGLNPAIILLSLSIWGSLMGMMGLIIGLPLTTLCLSYYKKYILRENDDNIQLASCTDNELDKTENPLKKE
ncbi:MAG: AI-2E family transporter [Bacteroidales bacterium]